MDELDKNQSYENFKILKLKKKSCKTKDSFKKPFDEKKLYSMNSKCFNFRCAKFDSTPTLVQISN
jgi:hypothetical protein